MGVPIGSLERILDQYPAVPENLISALQDVQAEFSFIPGEALSAICEYMGVPISRGWAVTTFYKTFSLEPRGEHEISVCAGTACHVRGASGIHDKFRRDLEMEAEEGTTRDLKFSLNKVRCLGCCSLAPVARIDEDTHSHLTQRAVGKLIKTYRKR